MMLSRMREQDTKYNVFLGFDGFVDQILKPIKTKAEEEVIPFRAMTEFSDYIHGKSGKSCSIDLQMLQEKIGGNMPIVANALGNLGCQAVCVGAMGYPEVNSIFHNMSANCKLISVSNPGYCNSLEFDDGKLMMATNTGVDCLDYEKIISSVDEETLISYFNGCDAAAFLNWGEMIRSNDIWEKILTQIMPRCNFITKKIMMVDFSDFSKRNSSEVHKMIELLNGYERYFNITISLNKNELDLLSDYLGIDKGCDQLDDQIKTLSEHLTCHNFVVHLLESSKYVKDGEVYTITKEVIIDPKIITGGGDNFNAGLLYGLLSGLDINRAIQMGSALSCLYVKNGRDVNVAELMDYMKDKYGMK